MSIAFEWDFHKAVTNLQKHDVSFNEAATVFGDRLSITSYDPDHSISEERFITMGVSAKGRILIVSHTDRGHAIRLVSARKATRHERRFYEEKK